MTDQRVIAESMEDGSSRVIDNFVRTMEADFGPHWRDLLGITEDVVAEAKKKKKSPKTVVSQKQLALFRALAKGPPSRKRVKDPATGQTRIKNTGHTPEAWAKIVARLPKDSNLSDPKTAVKVAREVLKNSNMPVNPSTGKKFSVKQSGLPEKSTTRYASYKRRRRGTEPAQIAAPVAENINTYVPVDDEFATKLKAALGG